MLQINCIKIKTNQSTYNKSYLIQIKYDNPIHIILKIEIFNTLKYILFIDNNLYYYLWIFNIEKQYFGNSQFHHVDFYSILIKKKIFNKGVLEKNGSWKVVIYMMKKTVEIS